MTAVVEHLDIAWSADLLIGVSTVFRCVGS